MKKTLCFIVMTLAMSSAHAMSDKAITESEEAMGIIMELAPKLINLNLQTHPMLGIDFSLDESSIEFTNNIPLGERVLESIERTLIPSGNLAIRFLNRVTGDYWELGKKYYGAIEFLGTAHLSDGTTQPIAGKFSVEVVKTWKDGSPENYCLSIHPGLFELQFYSRYVYRPDLSFLPVEDDNYLTIDEMTCIND